MWNCFAASGYVFFFILDILVSSSLPVTELKGSSFPDKRLWDKHFEVRKSKGGGNPTSRAEQHMSTYHYNVFFRMSEDNMWEWVSLFSEMQTQALRAACEAPAMDPSCLPRFILLKQWKRHVCFCCHSSYSLLNAFSLRQNQIKAIKAFLYSKTKKKSHQLFPTVLMMFIRYRQVIVMTQSLST